MRKQANTKLVAYLVIPLPFIGESDFEPVLYEALNQIGSLSQKLEFKLEDFGSHYPTIELLENSRVVKRQVTEIFPGLDINSHVILRISIEVPFPQSRLAWVSDEHLSTGQKSSLKMHKRPSWLYPFQAL